MHNPRGRHPGRPAGRRSRGAARLDPRIIAALRAGLTHQEIADAFGISLSAVTQALRRARAPEPDPHVFRMHDLERRRKEPAA